MKIAPRGGLSERKFALLIQKFRSLELARGIAALLVVFYHIDKYYYTNTKYYSASILNGAFKFGHSGVDFFFVLSGFIMLWANSYSSNSHNRAFDFIKKRFVRIYPLLWCSTLAMVALYLLQPGTGKLIYRTPLLIAESLVCVGRQPLNAIDFPSWTLWHENLFYVFCALILWRPKIGWAALAVWTAICLGCAFSQIDFETTFYPFASINALFFCGAAAALSLMRYCLPWPGFALMIGIITFFGTGAICDLHAVDERVQHLAFGLSSLIIIAGAVELERTGRLSLPACTEIAGTISYPLYLTHMLVLPIAVKTLFGIKWAAHLSPPLGAAVLVASTIAAALVSHRLIEKPAAKFLRGRLFVG